MRRHLLLAAASLLLGACASVPRPVTDLDQRRKEVEATERAFARTMAARDHAGFVSFLAEDTVFFSGPTPLRGRQAVADWWKKLYTQPAAPFTWAPDKVEILDSGELAMSTGPVHDPKGKLVGRFTSVWRRQGPGEWKIIFDNGCDACQECRK